MSGQLHDVFEETLTPLLRLKPLFLLRDGIFSPFERERIRNQGALIPVPTRRSPSEITLLCELHHLSDSLQWAPYSAAEHGAKPVMLIENIGPRIRADLDLLKPGFARMAPAGIQIEGNSEDVFIHEQAAISKFAVIDTTHGPVVIDAGARIGALSLIRGPAYIGKGTWLDACHFSNAIAGNTCRLGGEIAETTQTHPTHKHHEGFLGHSLVGDWVNLGALTTTSDLKNNYGEVRLSFGLMKYSADSIKLGSIIGDYAKTAIGTMLGTGSIIDLGANLFNVTHRSGYMRPFLWGENKVYDRVKFLEDAARMMQRRGQKVTAPLEQLLRAVRSS